MDKFKAHTFYNIGRLLERIAHVHGSDSPPNTGFSAGDPVRTVADEPLNESDKSDIRSMIEAVRDECEEIKLYRSVKYANHLISETVDRERVTNARIAFLIRELGKHVRWDMEEQLFMFIPPGQSGYYKNSSLLSDKAKESFPSASEEIIESGNCYAANLSTASVFHSMRSLEKPIQVIADEIKLTLSKNIELVTWGTIYNEIDKKIVALRLTAHTHSRDEELSFYCEANKEFGYFKDAWRNFVSHGRKSYDAPQSLSVLNHVTEFIERISLRGLKE